MGIQSAQVDIKRFLILGLILWSTGVGPRELTKKLDVQKTESGRSLVDRYLKVLGRENVYALGDCAEIEDDSLPPTAQVAQQQGAYLSRVLNAYPAEPKPFVFKFLGVMAYVGGKKSLFVCPVLSPNEKDSKFFKGSGFISWILWRSVYFTRLGSIKNRFQVPYGWLSDSY